MNKMYVLSFDPHKSDANRLHELVKENRSIKDWSHYLASSYVLISDVSEDSLTDYFVRNWHGNKFMIVEVVPRNRNGWLPNKAWEWFKKNTK